MQLTAFCCIGRFPPGVEASAGPLVLNTKGGYRDPALGVRYELTKLVIIFCLF